MNGTDEPPTTSFPSTIRKAKDEERERDIWQTTFRDSFTRGNTSAVAAAQDANKAVDTFRVYFGIKP